MPTGLELGDLSLGAGSILGGGLCGSDTGSVMIRHFTEWANFGFYICILVVSYPEDYLLRYIAVPSPEIGPVTRVSRGVGVEGERSSKVAKSKVCYRGIKSVKTNPPYPRHNISLDHHHKGNKLMVRFFRITVFCLPKYRSFLKLQVGVSRSCNANREKKGSGRVLTSNSNWPTPRPACH